MTFENYLTFYSQEKTCFGVSFYAGLQVKFFNKRLQHTYFCGNIAIFLKASTLKNICECFIPLEPSQMFSSAGEVVKCLHKYSKWSVALVFILSWNQMHFVCMAAGWWSRSISNTPFFLILNWSGKEGIPFTITYSVSFLVTVSQ